MNREMKIIYAVLGAVIVAVAVGWTVQNQSIPAVPPNGTSIDAAGWKTYRNEEYGFEIKYPNFFEGSLVDVIRIQNQITLVFGNDSIEYGVPEYPTEFKGDLASIDLPVPDPTTSTDAWVSRMSSFETVGHTATDRCERTKIGLYEGAWCGGLAVDESLVSDAWRAYFIQTPRGGFAAWSRIFDGYYDKGKDEMVEISKTRQRNFFLLADQILSTFKFIK
ncbi:MAG: hypothetical protein HY436_01095 [Candidatus Liptonbacteria bacterium]|nr:hypothetical protein [Candidatus Liptonbacteria bacterium]